MEKKGESDGGVTMRGSPLFLTYGKELAGQAFSPHEKTCSRVGSYDGLLLR
jgi:hypothetical protein